MCCQSDDGLRGRQRVVVLWCSLRRFGGELESHSLAAHHLGPLGKDLHAVSSVAWQSIWALTCQCGFAPAIRQSSPVGRSLKEASTLPTRARRSGRPPAGGPPHAAPSPSPRKSSVDGSRDARGNWTLRRVGRVQSSVRPVDAAVRDCWP